MKAYYPVIVIFVSLFISSCEKETISRKDIIGDWLFEKEITHNIYYDGEVSDTTINFGNVLYLIDDHDTLTTQYFEYSSTTRFVIQFIPPDTLLFYPCPLNMLCLHNIPTRYRVIKVNDEEMIWQHEYEWVDEKRAIVRLYFTKYSN